MKTIAKKIKFLLAIAVAFSFIACSQSTNASQDESKVKKETFKDVEVKDGKTITTTEYQYEKGGKVVGKGRTVEKEVSGGKIKRTEESHGYN